MRMNFGRAADSPAADQSRPHWIKGQEPEAPRFRSRARSSPPLKGARRDRYVSPITGESESATVPELTASAGIKLN